jgi:hypothetical protein
MVPCSPPALRITMSLAAACLPCKSALPS